MNANCSSLFGSASKSFMEFNHALGTRDPLTWGMCVPKFSKLNRIEHITLSTVPETF